MTSNNKNSGTGNFKLKYIINDQINRCFEIIGLPSDGALIIIKIFCVFIKLFHGFRMVLLKEL